MISRSQKAGLTTVVSGFLVVTASKPQVKVLFCLIFICKVLLASYLLMSAKQLVT